MRQNKEMTVILYSCEAAATEIIRKGTIRKVEKPIAFEISKAFPNLTIIAPDGFVGYKIGKDGRTKIEHVRNHKGNGGFITIKKGAKIKKEELNTSKKEYNLYEWQENIMDIFFRKHYINLHI